MVEIALKQYYTFSFVIEMFKEYYHPICDLTMLMPRN